MKDLTKGPIVRVILSFALPIFLGQIIQLFYGLTDTWIIGKFISKNALAAVGAVTPINDLILGFLIGLTNGFAILTAQSFGSKNYIQVKRSFAASLVLSLLMTVLLTILSIIFLPQLLKLINMDSTLMDISYNYIKFILLGMIASTLYNVFASTLRALGDTKAALIFLAFSAFINVILTTLFIVSFDTGVAGASIATVISQGVSAFLCYVYIRKNYSILRLSIDDFRWNKSLIKRILTSGISMGLMGSLVSLGSLALQSSINTFSNDIIVAHYGARKLTSIFMLPLSILGMTMTSFCSQNYGARNFTRIKEGITKSTRIAWAWCILVILITYSLVPTLVELITSTTSNEVISTATLYLRVDTLLYFVTAIISIYRNALMGMGENITPIISSSIELIGKFATVLFLTPLLGYMGIILSEPIVWCIMVIPLIYRLNQVLKSNIETNDMM